MSEIAQNLANHIRNHRCYSHPVFQNWAVVAPGPEAIGALFHQIQSFCSSTRPGWNLPEGVAALGLSTESHLIQEIVDSEEDHGPELATMAGHIVNKAAGRDVCPDLDDQHAVEAKLKEFSDDLLGTLPGYDQKTGLTVQARKAIAVFERRKSVDRTDTYRNLGAALALEMISNRQLIPGEKHCLLDSGLYGVDIDEPEMHYLQEHWGEVGAEQMHENNAVAVVASVMTVENEALFREGADEFLDSLASLWDLLDASLLQSGHRAAA
jgi:hypothetical protein